MSRVNKNHGNSISPELPCTGISPNMRRKTVQRVKKIRLHCWIVRVVNKDESSCQPLGIFQICGVEQPLEVLPPPEPDTKISRNTDAKIIGLPGFVKMVRLSLDCGKKRDKWWRAGQRQLAKKAKKTSYLQRDRTSHQSLVGDAGIEPATSTV